MKSSPFRALLFFFLSLVFISLLLFFFRSCFRYYEGKGEVVVDQLGDARIEDFLRVEGRGEVYGVEVEDGFSSLVGDCEIRGMVRSASSGMALSHVCLKLVSWGGGREPACTLSDDDGWFVFSGLKVGTYSICAWRKGYGFERTPPIRINRFSSPLSVEISMARMVLIDGVVVAPTGEVVEGASIVFYPETPGSSGEEGFKSIPVRVDELELPPPLSDPRLIPVGHLGIMVGGIPDFNEKHGGENARPFKKVGNGCGCFVEGMSGGISQTWSDSSGAFSLYVPEGEGGYIVVTHDLFAPEKVKVGGGSSENELKVTLSDGRGIEGVVLDSEGRAVADSTIWVELDEYGLVRQTETCEDGRFTLKNLKGEVVITALKKGYFPERKNVNLNEDSKVKIVFRLVSRETLLYGVVVNQRRYPVSGASVLIRSYQTDYGAIERRCTTDSGGIFYFPPLVPGRWELIVKSKSYATESWIIDSDEWSDGTEFVLKKPGGISGRVLDDSTYLPIGSFQIRLTGKEVIVDRTFQNEKGKYMISAIPAGRYTIEVIAEGYMNAYEDVFIPQGTDSLEVTVEHLDFYLIPE